MKDGEYMGWYARAEVKFELIRFLKNRELCLIAKQDSNRTIRNLRCHSVQHLDFILNRWLKVGTTKEQYKFYYSLARYKAGIPYQTANLDKRDNSEWNESHWKEMESYDFLLDIDSPTHNEILLAHQSALEVKAMLDSLHCPYELRFSGCGFHFIIAHRHFINYLANFVPGHEHSIYVAYAKIGRWFYDNISEMVDYSIYDSRRVTKIPFSLALYEDEAFVCLPFHTSESFTAFKLEDFSVERFLGDTKRFRGLGTHEFNSGRSAKRLVSKILGEEEPIRLNNRLRGGKIGG
jgi:hypothetical protein